MWLLAHLLNRFIRNGVLRLIAADGSLHVFGGHGPGPTVTVRLQLLGKPRLAVCQSLRGGKSCPRCVCRHHRTGTLADIVNADQPALSSHAALAAAPRLR